MELLDVVRLLLPESDQHVHVRQDVTQEHDRPLRVCSPGGMGHTTDGNGVDAPQTLGKWVKTERERRSLTRAELAARLRKVDKTLSTSPKTVEHWELRGDRPQLAAVRALAAVFDVAVERLTAMLDQPAGSSPLVPMLDVGPAEPADAAYVEAIRGTVRALVALEVQHGGDDVAPLAVRAFRAAQRRLAAGGYPQSLGRDLHAAAGELAEVAGWLLHDADRQQDARAINVEALYLLRLAGDRSTELLTVSNMAFVSLFVHQPAEALLLARSALEAGHLTNRQRVIFQLREARALAQLGAGPSAVREAARAQSSFWDGPTREDPTWSWWVDEPEVAGHVAWAYLEAGEPAKAAPMLQRSVEASTHPNNHLFRSARFLDANVDASAWTDAEAAVTLVLPYLSEIKSGRAARLLRQAASRIDAAPAASRPATRGRPAPARRPDGGRILRLTRLANRRSRPAAAGQETT